ncbi:MAG: hypothetical protein EOO88_06025 [Pedobacter sp.]|nr:MAG: hypothetical protein EOO88_06025 [Pedobacter sp.]
MFNFECLHLLENFHLSIVEVKRLDLEADASVSERFIWLRIDKDSGAICQLTFRSMDAASEIQERYFEQGFLKFNATIGTYIEKFNSAQHPLEVLDISGLSEESRTAITGYLLTMGQTA